VGLKGDTIQGDGPAKPGHAPVIDNITKKGTIIFRAGKTAVRDDGERLQVSREASREGLQEALRLAMERYGNRITVNGTTEFKAQIIRAGNTMQEVVDQLHDEYGWSDSVSNLSGKLQRESLRYREAVELADVLGYDIVWQKRRD